MIKIPINVSIYYCTVHNVITFTDSFIWKTLKLKTQLIINKHKKILKITREPFSSVSNHEKKRLKILQATQVALVKQTLLEISGVCCKRLKLIGVGFRVSYSNTSNFDLLLFKLGYSHVIYFKIPKSLDIFCLKSNKLFIIGNSYTFVTQIAAVIRSYKIPEFYKGKGILYTSEKIILKKGKKA